MAEPRRGGRKFAPLSSGIVLAALDRAQALLWRAGLRFQWPCWLLDRAWDRQATPYVPVAAQLEDNHG